MKCYRCGGMMIDEKVYSEAEQLRIWRCVLCGEYIDQVILENRQYQKTIRENSRKKKAEPMEKERQRQAAVSLPNPNPQESLSADQNR
jgi:hypothetical protein